MIRVSSGVSLFVIALMASTSATAATIYRWVDEQGKVHYSEVVPERHRNSAKPVDLTGSRPSPEQQRDAIERAEREKARAVAVEATQGRQPASAALAASPSQPTPKRPAQVPNERTDCETWQRLYQESVECFGPYRTVNRATKPEAFDVCNVVPAPPSRCRPRIR